MTVTLIFTLATPIATDNFSPSRPESHDLEPQHQHIEKVEVSTKSRNHGERRKQKI